jgi:hypothetical protein
MTSTTTKRPSEYGHKWNPKVPRWAVKDLLGRTHVSTPWEEIAAELDRRMDANEGFTANIRRQTHAFAKLAWQENLNLYAHVMGGSRL